MADPAAPREGPRAEPRPDDQQNVGDDELSTLATSLPTGGSTAAHAAKTDNGVGVTSAGGESGLPHRLDGQPDWLEKFIAQALAMPWTASVAEAWMAKSVESLRTALASARAALARIAKLVPRSEWTPEQIADDVAYMHGEYSCICVNLREITTKHNIGLGGERLDELVCAEIDRARAALDAKDAEFRKWEELRRAVAELTGCDVETWPTHGNAPLAIASTVALQKAALDEAKRREKYFQHELERWEIWMEWDKMPATRPGWYDYYRERRAARSAVSRGEADNGNV